MATDLSVSWAAQSSVARQVPLLSSKVNPQRKLYELPPILNAQNISKSYGASPLFRNVAFTVSEGDRIGLIGPNGSGKSTLLQILSGAIEPDSGEVALRKRVRLSLVHQESQFAAGQTVRVRDRGCSGTLRRSAR